MSFNLNISNNDLKKNNSFSNSNEFEEYYLLKENNFYKFIISIFDDDIIINCKKYELKINKNDLPNFITISFKSIDYVYKYFINLFENNRISIKNIKINKYISLICKTDFKNIEKESILLLNYGKNHQNHFFGNNGKLINEINNLKKEIKILNNKIENLTIHNNLLREKLSMNQPNENPKKNQNNPNNKEQNKNLEKNSFSLNFIPEINPKKIIFPSNIVYNSNTSYFSFNNYIVFKAIDDITYLIYANNLSIISFNINENKTNFEIKNAHNKPILSFRYYNDNANKQDLFISISGTDHNIKLWNFNKTELIADIQTIYSNFFNQRLLKSACFLNDNNQTFIITTNPVKVFNFKGEIVKNINELIISTDFIDVYYDKKYHKIYILISNECFIKAFDYNENKTYKYFKENMVNFCGGYFIIKEKDGIAELIESCYDGYIKIWNFHSGDLLSKIKVCLNVMENNGTIVEVGELCIWDDDYIFVGGNDLKIKLVELKTEKIIKELYNKEGSVKSLKQFIHPKYGKCLISQDGYSGTIKLWIIEK